MQRFKDRLDEMDLSALARDVEPLLFTPEQRERVTAFREYWANK